MKEATISIEILGWKKFNYRKDVTAPRWFRLDHGLFDDPQFYGFSHGELCAWLYLLCLASKKSSACVLLNFDQAEKVARLKRSIVLSAIEKLSQLQIVTVDVTGTSRARDVDGTQTCSTLHNRTEHDMTIQARHAPVTSASRLLPDLEEAYRLYPRKEGKSVGMKRLRTQIKTPPDLVDLLRAIGRYKSHLSKTFTEPKFVMLFSTFASSWRDWLAPDAGRIEAPGSAAPDPAPARDIDADYLRRFGMTKEQFQHADLITQRTKEN